jgi:dipeptidyl aminopeptidase/acylaminoacyl peptidase
MRGEALLPAEVLAGIPAAFAEEQQTLKTSELADAFGQVPFVSDVRMASDGDAISYLFNEIDGRNYGRLRRDAVPWMAKPGRCSMARLLLTAVVYFSLSVVVFAKDKQAYETDPLAAKFGTLADVRGLRLSPDGTKISLIKWLDQDVPAAIVFDLTTHKGKTIALSKQGEFRVTWCDWANDERLLCGYRSIAQTFGIKGYYATTRLIAVNADGSKMKVLLDRELRDEFSQFQDRIVDWLPDDPENVLVQVPRAEGVGVARLNIYTGLTETEAQMRDNSRSWMADGRGNLRLFSRITSDKIVWYVRATKDAPWRVLHESKMTDPDSFAPAGFSDDEDEFLFFDADNGHEALWAQNLSTDEQPHIVFSDDTVDVEDLLALGKYRRLVAVGYVTDRPHLHFFDKAVADIHTSVQALFPHDGVDILDESWDQRYYLVYVSSDKNPGMIYRLDNQTHQLAQLLPVFPKLIGTTMAPVKTISFKARDGVEVPGYLTLPVSGAQESVPTVVLPHGGPQSRDIGEFDPIVQFLAASGYAVLQVNFRGSGGYGEEWAGPGGFQNWRQAIQDITDGAKSLIADGTSDSNRMCIVGWSYGGYASLMSAIEEPDLYRCSVSIAGVTDPKTFVKDFSGFIESRAMKAFVGKGDEVLGAGSPQHRAAEIKVPVLLFHGEKDLNVSVEQSKEMAEKLEGARVPFEYIQYEDVEHSIQRNQFRIDMLARIAEFLAKNIGPATAVAAH